MLCVFKTWFQCDSSVLTDSVYPHVYLLVLRLQPDGEKNIPPGLLFQRITLAVKNKNKDSILYFILFFQLHTWDRSSVWFTVFPRQKSTPTIIHKMLLPVVKPGSGGKEELKHNWRAIFHVYTRSFPQEIECIVAIGWISSHPISIPFKSAILVYLGY